MTRWAVLVATIGVARAVFAAELDFGSEANHAVSNYQTVFAALPTVKQNQPPSLSTINSQLPASPKYLPTECHQLLTCKTCAQSEQTINILPAQRGGISGHRNPRGFFGTSCSPLGHQSDALVTFIALECFEAFLSNDRNHRERGHRIGPPPAKEGIKKQSAEQNRG